MLRKSLRVASLCAIIAGVGVIITGAYSTADAKAAAAAGIEDIMKKSFNKKSGVCPKIGPAAKEGKWDEAQKLAKELAECGAALPGNKCPMGDEKSWEKLTKQFVAETKAVAAACEKKDAAGVEAALKTLGASCKACHDAHR